MKVSRSLAVKNWCWSLIVGLVITFCSLTAIAQEEACVLYFTFSENSGKSVKDESKAGNDGKKQGGVKWVKGKYVTALEFSGKVGDFVEVEDNATLNPAKQISYMAWFMSKEYDNTRGIISKYWDLVASAPTICACTMTSQVPFQLRYHPMVSFSQR